MWSIHNAGMRVRYFSLPFFLYTNIFFLLGYYQTMFPFINFSDFISRIILLLYLSKNFTCFVQCSSSFTLSLSGLSLWNDFLMFSRVLLCHLRRKYKLYWIGCYHGGSYQNKHTHMHHTAILFQLLLAIAISSFIDNIVLSLLKICEILWFSHPVSTCYVISQYLWYF